MELRVTTTVGALVASIRELATDQLPFATAVALTRTAQDARDAARERLPRAFTLRSKTLAKSIRFDPARKKDWPNASARVGTLAQVLVHHEFGGVRRPKKSHIAIPTRAVKRTSGGRIPKALQPKQHRRTDEDLIVRAKGRKSRLNILFLLRPQVRIKPRLGFRKVVQETVEERLSGHFSKSMEEALATRKNAAQRALERVRKGG